MKILSKYRMQEIVIKHLDTWRPLEMARYNYHFSVSDEKPVLETLVAFQNPDGGFGLALEPDFQMPHSSPMATSVALQILTELSPSDAVIDTVDQALAYLTKTYNPRLKGWYATDKSVNDYPHAPWWSVDQTLTPLQSRNEALKQWGNPTMELLGYFIKWHHDRGEEAFKAQLDHAQEHLSKKEEFEPHELYCYLRSYPYLAQRRQEQLAPVIQKAIKQLVVTSPQDWQDYVPKPLDFIKHPNEERFGLSSEALNVHLDYLVDHFNTSEYLEPTWQWGQYPEKWEEAKRSWRGILTLNALICLKNFGRIL